MEEKQNDVFTNEEKEEFFTNPHNSKNFFLAKKNHPLMLINDYKEQNLLMHEVTKALIDHKWKKVGRWIYLINLIFYCCFLATLTTYIMTSISLSPLKYPNLFTCSDYFNESQFTNPNQTYIFPEHALHRDSLNYASRAFICLFAILRLASVLIGYEKSYFIEENIFKSLNVPRLYVDCAELLISHKSNFRITNIC